MNMKLSNIIISGAFSKTLPADKKMKACREYYHENGKLDRDIVVSHEGILIDGYVGYLVLKENGVNEADVLVSNLVLYQKSKNYHNTETVYVYGSHSGKEGEYVWRISPQTKNTDQLQVGKRAMVRTRNGNKIITITNIRTLKEPPIKGVVKKVIQCLSD